MGYKSYNRAQVYGGQYYQLVWWMSCPPERWPISWAAIHQERCFYNPSDPNILRPDPNDKFK